MNILLVYPATPETFWSFKHVLRFVSKRAAFPPLGLLTVAAMLPTDWQVKLVDLNVNRISDDDLRWADYVMLSAMIVHQASVAEIVNRCRRWGTPIIAGGPLFTTGHTAFPDIEHFVLGEAEEVMPQVIEDMCRGTVRHTYAASSRPVITHVPSPRWDLYERIRTFLESHRPQGPRLRLCRADVQAFLKSLWLLGVWHRGRFAYWRCCITTLLRSPRQFPVAIELAIIGFHFRRVASLL